MSASRIATSETSGMSSPSRSRLMPTSTSNIPRRRSRMISTRSTVSMSECSSAHARRARRGLGEVLGHPFGQGGDQHAVAHRHLLADLAEQSSTWVATGRISTGGRPGRWAHHQLDHAAGRLRAVHTAPASPRRRCCAARVVPIPSKRSGRLSARTAGGTELDEGFLARTVAPLYIAPICGIVTRIRRPPARASDGR